MQSLPQDYRALVIGASGAIGAAIVRQLEADPRCAQVLALSRRSTPRLDFQEESTIARAADQLRDQGPLHLIVVATGMLHGASGLPEKRLAQLNSDQMMASFAINAIGPAVALAHFTPLLARQERSLLAVLSAKVGSIEDNRLGGWYSYRASKAALNMLVKTASIELARTHPQAVLAALHPGTVDSPLSAPFQAPHGKHSPEQAAALLMQVLDGLPTENTGSFWAYDGQRLPW
jgi:NAD(P)-dependent dehydrogenase (short-subunit alcohol dehydrogenase family)